MKFLTIIFAILCLLVAAWYAYIPPVHLPEIAKNLSASEEVANVEFGKRIRDIFPDGTAEYEIVNRLSKEKFKIHLYDKSKDEKEISYALFEKPGLPCMAEWFVYWETKKDGTIKILDYTHYGLTCL